MKKLTPIEAMQVQLSKTNFNSKLSEKMINMMVTEVLPVSEERQNAQAWRAIMITFSSSIFKEDYQNIIDILNSSVNGKLTVAKTKTKESTGKSKIKDVSRGDDYIDTKGGCVDCGNDEEETPTREEPTPKKKKLSDLETVEEILEYLNNDVAKLRTVCTKNGIALGNTKDPKKVAKKLLDFMNEE